MQVLSLFGKLLTGSWEQIFYTSSKWDISHGDGIDNVKKVIACLRNYMQDPTRVFIASSNYLGNILDCENDST